MGFIKKIQFRNRSVFFSWLLSYFLLLLVPISISSFVYIKARDMIESDTYRANSVMLQQSRQTIDGGLQDINRFMGQVALNSRFKYLMSLKGDIHSVDYDTVYQAVNDFTCYRVFSGLIEDYFIYFKGINKVFTANGLVDKEMFFKSTRYFNEANYDQYEELLEGKYCGRYITLESMQNSGNEIKENVIYEQPLALFQKPDDSKATLIILLNQARFQETLQAMQTVHEGWGMIIDTDGKILFASDSFVKDGSWNFSYDKFPGDEGILHENINNKEIVISYITSQTSKWKYISAIPFEVYWSKVDFIRRLTLISALLSIFLSALVAYYLAKKNYYPINELVNLFDKSTGNISIKKFNEYRFIKEAMNHTIFENNEINKKLNQQNHLLRSNFLTKLIKGRYDDSDFILKTLPIFEIKFDSDIFAVMLFHITDYKSFINNNQIEKYSEEVDKLVHFIITNVVEELAAQKNKGYMVEIDETLVCMINFSEEDYGKCKQEMLAIANEARNFIKCNFNFDFMVSVSSIHKSFFGIADAYREALDAAEYGIIMENTGIISYDDLKVLDGDYNYSIEAELQLINCIKAGDFEASKTVLNEIFDNNFSKTTLPNDVVRCLIFDLVSTMLKTMNEIKFAFDEKFLKEIDIVARLTKCEKVYEMKQQMLDILSKICVYIQQNKKSKKVTFIEEVVKFIENNYSDVNLSVTVIADQFELTSPYLTKLFKEYVGEGLFDYISKIRMEKAKTLLKSREMSIKDIALKVGYYNSNVFIRAFKKYTGITPGSYMEIG